MKLYVTREMRTFGEPRYQLSRTKPNDELDCDRFVELYESEYVLMFGAKAPRPKPLETIVVETTMRKSVQP